MGWIRDKCIYGHSNMRSTCYYCFFFALFANNEFLYCMNIYYRWSNSRQQILSEVCYRDKFFTAVEFIQEGKQKLFYEKLKQTKIMYILFTSKDMECNKHFLQLICRAHAYLIVVVPKGLQATLQDMISIDIFYKIKETWFKCHCKWCNLLLCFETLDQFLHWACAGTRK